MKRIGIVILVIAVIVLRILVLGDTPLPSGVAENIAGGVLVVIGMLGAWLLYGVFSGR